MSLNKYMHPRNPYKSKKPDFKQLASKYEQFEKHVTQDLRGRVSIDFKNPECLRALSWALLKEDFNLDVEMPLDRLIPTIPLRLNYILWLEDLVQLKQNGIKGIDVGTGAACIYPLLGTRKNAWAFVATETDAVNFSYAQKNVAQNGLDDKIKVVQVASDTFLQEVFRDNDDAKFDFCMTNPPFFGSNLEAWGMLTSRSDDRSEPRSASTASPVEAIAPGGEVQFVKQLIADSLLYKDRVRIFTTMLGKKSSLGVLKQELVDNGITNVGQMEFCQGRTMRWGLGWSFDDTVNFPKPVPKTKAKPPITYAVPRQSPRCPGLSYTLGAVAEKVLTLLTQLKVQIEPDVGSSGEKRWAIIARENTWSNQRRKRRLQARQADDHGDAKRSALDGGPGDTRDDPGPDSSGQLESRILDQQGRPNTDQRLTQIDHATEPAPDASPVDTVCHVDGRHGDEARSEGGVVDAASAPHEHQGAVVNYNGGTDTAGSVHAGGDSNKKTETKTEGQSSPETAEAVAVSDGGEIFRATLLIASDALGTITVAMDAAEGKGREQLHQVLQYIKNHVG